MEEERKLYPLRFCRLQDDYSWGSDSFLLADLGYRDSLVKDGWLAGNAMSEVMDMYMDRVVGESAFEYWGRQFPVQVKHIDVKGRMPLRVHPDRETAESRYDFLGREKLWYVRRAGKDACIMLGFNRDTDASEVYSACLDGSVGALLRELHPRAGQCFHIAPGVPHSASGDIELIEVSESSPLDFCMCGWGAEVSTDEFDPALNLVDALDFICYKAVPVGDRPAGSTGMLLNLREFRVSGIALAAPVKVEANGTDTFTVYACVSGSASVQIQVFGQTASFALESGEAMLVPAECEDYVIVPSSSDTFLLEIGEGSMDQADPYINPAAEPSLSDEE